MSPRIAIDEATPLPRRHFMRQLCTSQAAMMAVLLFKGVCSRACAEDATRESKPRTFAQLLELNEGQLKTADIAWTNMLCAQGLPFADDVLPADCISRLDQWADKVRTATSSNFYRYQRSPAQFENSEPFFRMLVLVTVVQKDCGVSYNPARVGGTGQEASNTSSFFLDSRDLFLHGLLAGRQMGTCASLPVLVVALGRRLGYPLKLVEAKTHLFVRWESADGKTRMNVECTHGLSSYPDEHYQKWPLQISEEEIRSGQYLKSLEAAEELATFLVMRACCLESNGKWPEAIETMEAAHRLAPKIRRYADAVARSRKFRQETPLLDATPPSK